MSRPQLVALLSILVLGGCSGAEPSVSTQEVTRVLTTLASDDLRGRDSFTEDGMRAAEVVAAEFRAAGLDSIDGADGYLQRFPIWSITPRDVIVTLNGARVPDEHVAASLATEVLHWRHGTGPVVTLVGEEENLFQAFREARASGSDVVLVVSTRHEDMFRRMRGFINRASRTSDLSGGTSLVAVLSDVVEVRDYEVSATAVVSENTLANVVGVVPGRRDDEFVLFSGHYDHVGIVQPVDGDSIANGANDDASGTAAVVELSRIFRRMGTPERTLLFVAFAAEESGGWGSRHFAGTVDPNRIVAMLNIEMIGKVATEGPNAAWITGFDRSDLGAILGRAVEGTPYSFHPDPYPDQNLFYRSDNATFARLGVPAHSISTTPIDEDPDYHRVTDEVETLDMDHVAAVIRAIAIGAEPIVSGEATPTRVAPDGSDD